MSTGLVCYLSRFHNFNRMAPFNQGCKPPIDKRSAFSALDLAPDVPPFFGALLQAYALRDQDEAALLADIEHSLRDERAAIVAFVTESRAPEPADNTADDDDDAAAAALQRLGTGHALFDAAVESAIEEWTRAAAAAGQDDRDNSALIEQCLGEVEKDKVTAREKTTTTPGGGGEGFGEATKLVVEGLPRSCGELMQEWRGLKGHDTDVVIIGPNAVEFSL